MHATRAFAGAATVAAERIVDPTGDLPQGLIVEAAQNQHLAA